MSNNNLSPTMPVMQPSPKDTSSNTSQGPGPSPKETSSNPSQGPGPGGTATPELRPETESMKNSSNHSIVEKLSEDVKNWKDETRQELFKRSISESPDFSKTGNRDILGGSVANLTVASGGSGAGVPGGTLTSKVPGATGSKFGSTFSIVKHKRVELTTFSDER